MVNRISFLPIKDDGSFDSSLYTPMRLAYDMLHIEVNSKTTDAEVTAATTAGATQFDAYESAVSAYKASTGTGTALTEVEIRVVAEYALEFNNTSSLGDFD